MSYQDYDGGLGDAMDRYDPDAELAAIQQHMYSANYDPSQPVSALLEDIPPSAMKHREPSISMIDDPQWEAVWDDDSGAYYYYNQETMETTWVPPPLIPRFGGGAALAAQMVDAEEHIPTEEEVRDSTQVRFVEEKPTPRSLQSPHSLAGDMYSPQSSRPDLSSPVPNISGLTSPPPPLVPPLDFSGASLKEDILNPVTTGRGAQSARNGMLSPSPMINPPSPVVAVSPQQSSVASTATLPPISIPSSPITSSAKTPVSLPSFKPIIPEPVPRSPLVNSVRGSSKTPSAPSTPTSTSSRSSHPRTPPPPPREDYDRAGPVPALSRPHVTSKTRADLLHLPELKDPPTSPRDPVVAEPVKVPVRENGDIVTPSPRANTSPEDNVRLPEMDEHTKKDIQPSVVHHHAERDATVAAAPSVSPRPSKIFTATPSTEAENASATPVDQREEPYSGTTPVVFHTANIQEGFVSAPSSSLSLVHASAQKNKPTPASPSQVSLVENTESGPSPYSTSTPFLDFQVPTNGVPYSAPTSGDLDAHNSKPASSALLSATVTPANSSLSLIAERSSAPVRSSAKDASGLQVIVESSEGPSNSSAGLERTPTAPASFATENTPRSTADSAEAPYRPIEKTTTNASPLSPVAVVATPATEPQSTKKPQEEIRGLQEPEAKQVTAEVEEPKEEDEAEAEEAVEAVEEEEEAAEAPKPVITVVTPLAAPRQDAGAVMPAAHRRGSLSISSFNPAGLLPLPKQQEYTAPVLEDEPTSSYAQALPLSARGMKSDRKESNADGGKSGGVTFSAVLATHAATPPPTSPSPSVLSPRGTQDRDADGPLEELVEFEETLPEQDNGGVGATESSLGIEKEPSISQRKPLSSLNLSSGAEAKPRSSMDLSRDRDSQAQRTPAHVYNQRERAQEEQPRESTSSTVPAAAPTVSPPLASTPTSTPTTPAAVSDPSSAPSLTPAPTAAPVPSTTTPAPAPTTSSSSSVIAAFNAAISPSNSPTASRRSIASPATTTAPVTTPSSAPASNPQETAAAASPAPAEKPQASGPPMLGRRPSIVPPTLFAQNKSEEEEASDFVQKAIAAAEARVREAQKRKESTADPTSPTPDASQDDKSAPLASSPSLSPSPSPAPRPMMISVDKGQGKSLHNILAAANAENDTELDERRRSSVAMTGEPSARSTKTDENPGSPSISSARSSTSAPPPATSAPVAYTDSSPQEGKPVAAQPREGSAEPVMSKPELSVLNPDKAPSSNDTKSRTSPELRNEVSSSTDRTQQSLRDDPRCCNVSGPNQNCVIL